MSARSTASAPSYTADDMNGIILDTYNTGNPYPRYMNFIAKAAGNTDSNIGFWTEEVDGSPNEKMRIGADGHVKFNHGLTGLVGGGVIVCAAKSSSGTANQSNYKVDFTVPMGKEMQIQEAFDTFMTSDTGKALGYAAMTSNDLGMQTHTHSFSVWHEDISKVSPFMNWSMIMSNKDFQKIFATFSKLGIEGYQASTGAHLISSEPSTKIRISGPIKLILVSKNMNLV